MNKQYYVSVHGQEQRQQAIAWLEKHGYQNVQNLTTANYSFPVFVIEGNKFFGANTTCMAALATKGVRPISWQAWQTMRND